MSGTTKKKTFTAMQFVDMLETDYSIRTAKKQLVWTTNSLAEFNFGYWQWKHDYRSRYSEKALLRYGFNPSSDGLSIEFNDDAIFEYMKENIEPNILEVLTRTVSIATIEYQARYYLQRDGYDWTNSTNTLIHEGITYTLSYTSYKENDNPFLPDDTSIVVATFVDSSDNELVLEFENAFGNNIVFTVTYSIIGSTDFYIYMAENTEELQYMYDTNFILMTPIITLKQDGKIVPEETDLRRMMNKLNISFSDFKESLEETDQDGEPLIDNAYIMNGLPLRNPYVYKPGLYSALDAERFPAALLIKMNKSKNSEEYIEYANWLISESTLDFGEVNSSFYNIYNSFTGAITQEQIDDGYLLIPSVADSWYNEHVREQAYLARGLFRTFARYSDLYDDECTDKMTTRYLGNCVKDTLVLDEEGQPALDELGNVINEKQISNTFTIEKLDMSYTYDVQVETFEGTVRPEISDRKSQGDIIYSGKLLSVKDDDGKRTTTYTSDFDPPADPEEEQKVYVEDVLTIKVQINETQYQVMTITNYSQRFTISGRIFNNTLSSPVEEHRIALPYEILDEPRFTEYVTLYEHSFVMLAYAIKVVKIKWYERFAGIIIGALVCIFSGGAGCSLVSFVVSTIVGIAVSYVISIILEMVDSEILQLILGMAVSLAMMYLGGTDLSTLTAENYLKIATEISGKIYMNYQAEQAKIDAEIERIKQAEENIDEKIGMIDEANTLMPKAYMGAHFSSMDMYSPDAFYYQAYGETLFNFDHFYNVDAQIELRKQVTSG